MATQRAITKHSNYWDVTDSDRHSIYQYINISIHIIYMISISISISISIPVSVSAINQYIYIYIIYIYTYNINISLYQFMLAQHVVASWLRAMISPHHFIPMIWSLPSHVSRETMRTPTSDWQEKHGSTHICIGEVIYPQYGWLSIGICFISILFKSIRLQNPRGFQSNLRCPAKPGAIYDACRHRRLMSRRSRPGREGTGWVR